jgi:hypothetical protein
MTVLSVTECTSGCEAYQRYTVLSATECTSGYEAYHRFSSDAAEYSALIVMKLITGSLLITFLSVTELGQ